MVTGLLTVSCLEEIEAPQPVFESEELTLVPRVKSFTNQYVTKAEGDEAYTQAETKITHLAYLIFDGDGALVHKAEADVQNGVGLTLNKTNLNSSETAATVVMFANVNLADIKKANEDGSFTAISNTLTLEEFDDYGIHPTSDPVVLSADLSGSGFKGFPMKGIAQNVNLTTSSKDPIVVSLQILYAKINFDISVAAGTENQNYEGVTPSFTLSGYSVTNVPTSTPVKTLNDDETVGDIESTPSGTIYEYKGTEDDPSKTVSLNGTSASTFTFYMAESRYNHGGTDGVYPANLPDENKQQYKPLLATSGTGSPATGLATYVTVNGTYIDYRGTSWTVNYKVYLGKNSYDNFHVDRNSEYKNYLTIKGIRNNNSYTDAGSVWIDHRVDVELPEGSNSAADCVTITRETLIDAHIEVRPLRISLAGSNYTKASIYLPKYPIDASGNIIHNTTTNISSWSQVDEIMGGQNENWIAIENNNGKSNKGRLYLTNGKRKYFTTSLIEELYAESSEIKIDSDANRYIPLKDGDCAWIYFDENGTSNTRRAKIEVVFYPLNGSPVTETYDVYQYGHTAIGNSKVENYEEYLHSYDSEDKYNLQTSFVDYTQKGLEWGLISEKLSTNMLVSPLALSVISLIQQDPKNYISEDVRYDYFHKNDGSAYYIYNKNGNTWEDANFGTGLDFTNRAANAKNMTVTDMGTVPLSAYEYCLSKNKFHEDADGNHSMIIHWYLPDVYELSQLFSDSYTLGDMAKDAFYWSSQPSSTTYGLSSLPIVGGYLEGYSIKNEVADNARAVSKTGVVDTTRTAVNRIRCFYDATGQNADMSGRVPDGLGGILKIPMKAYYNARPGYFYDWLGVLEDKSYNTPTEPSYAYPTGGTATTFDDFTYNNVRYYTKDPSEKTSWSTNVTSQTLYYYEGLSPYEVVYDGAILVESGDRKTYQRTETTIAGQKIEALPSNEQLAAKTNANTDYSDYVILSFDKGSSKVPSYNYRREDSKAIVSYTKYWEVPDYQEHTFNESSGSNLGEIQLETQLASVIYLWYQEGGTYDYNGKTYSIKEKYTESSGFMGLTIKYYFVLTLGEEEITIEITDQAASNIYRNYNKGDNYFYEGVWYKIESKRSSWGKYYFTLGPTNFTKIGYTYIAGTGKWGAESDGSLQYGQTADVVDQLQLFGGNSFTISAKEGYLIKSIKVNYSDDNKVPNITGDLIDISYRNLRLVNGSESLPLTTALKYMSYSGDGQTGWFQWTAATVDEYASSVTLKLVTYAPTGANVLRPTTFRYEAPSKATGYQSDLETSIVIDSFEIRIEEVK